MTWTRKKERTFVSEGRWDTPPERAAAIAEIDVFAKLITQHVYFDDRVALVKKHSKRVQQLLRMFE